MTHETLYFINDILIMIFLLIKWKSILLICDSLYFHKKEYKYEYFLNEFSDIEKCVANVLVSF